MLACVFRITCMVFVVPIQLNSCYINKSYLKWCRGFRKTMQLNSSLWILPFDVFCMSNCILYWITFQVHIRDQPRPTWIESWKNKKKNLSSQFENSSLWILPFDVFCMSNCILKWSHFRCIFGINPDQRGSKVEKHKKKNLSSQFENSSLWILPFDVFCMSNCIL